MIVIIGAGISGLTVANGLPAGRECIVLEKENHIGGLSTQYLSGGYWFDFSGHYFHFQGNPGIQAYLEKFCRFNEYRRKSKTFLLGRYIPFPVQFHLSYLPVSLKNKILHEILESGHAHAANLRDFLEAHFGETLLRLFFKPFLTRYYNTELEGLAVDMDRGSIPVPDKVQVLAGFKGKTFSKAGYNPVIYYPETSLRDFIENYSAAVRDRIRLNEEVVEIDSDKQVARTLHRTYRYDILVTSMPLNRLLGIIKPPGRFPSHRQLKHVSTLLVNVILKRKRKRFHWVYLAEEKFPFYRVGLYAGYPYPAGYLERNVLPGSPPGIDKEKLRRDAAFTLKKLRVIESIDEIVYLDARIIPVSYVIFDKNWGKVVPPLLDELKKYNIYSIGRYGTWNYSNMSNDISCALGVPGGVLK
jgi:protoporphyrinogen oxidase